MIVECSGGGTGRHVLDLSQCLIERGCEVHILYSRGRIDRMFETRLDAITSLYSQVVPMRTAPHPSDWSAWRAIRRYMRAHGPFDVIHGHSSKGGALARLAALGTGVSAYYTLHGLIMLDPQLARLKRLIYMMIEFGLSLRTSRIIAVGPEEARAALRCGFGRKRVITVPNGVGPANLTARSVARAQLDVGPDDVVIGFVGRLVTQKAPEVLIAAFAAAVKSAPRARLAMVGSGPLENEMSELAVKLGVRDKVLMLGERDARTVLAAFDIFTLPSRKEGLPYVVLEAMAAGLPIVTTVSAGSEILVVPGSNGAVVATDDVAALACAFSELATNETRRAEYGRASLKRAAMFTVDAMADRTLEAYLCSQKKGRRQ